MKEAKIKKDGKIKRRKSKLILKLKKNYRSKKTNKRFIFLLYFLIIIIILLILFIIFNISKKKDTFLKKELNKQGLKIGSILELLRSKLLDETDMDLERINKEKKEIKEFSQLVSMGKLINPNETFYKSDNPKISIVISVYNGEGYIREALLSIQNQDFKDIEIIMVDDFSKDNSVGLIKELMQIDPRIILYQNEENRGGLYTRSKGVLNSKGKYVMVLDEDDIYAQKDAFSILYEEAERNNLDIIGFSMINYNSVSYFNKPSRYIETKVLYQPDILEQIYEHIEGGKIRKVGFTLVNHFVKTELFKKAVKLIDEKFFKIKINYNDDGLLIFLLTRNAFNFKKIKKIFYFVRGGISTNPQKIFRLKEKNKNYTDIACLSNLYFIELLLMKTNNTYEDKKIVSYEFEMSFLNFCRKNKYAKRKAIDICTKLYNNKYIDKDTKKKIINFFKERRIKYRFKYK